MGVIHKKKSRIYPSRIFDKHELEMDFREQPQFLRLHLKILGLSQSEVVLIQDHLRSRLQQPSNHARLKPSPLTIIIDCNYPPSPRQSSACLGCSLEEQTTISALL